jgi:Putative addiction module component
MDLATRKYNFIEEIFNLEKDTFERLEKFLKKERIEKTEVPAEHKIELDKRLKEFKNNPEDLLDWDKIKEEW